MKLLGIDGLTKLIQLIKASFISVDDTVEVSTLELAEVATTGDYEDLINTPEEVVVDQTFDGTSENAQSGVAINGAGFLKNTAVGYGSLNILGNATNYTFSTTLGSSAYAPNNNTLAIGVNATAKSESSVALGSYNTTVGTSSNYSTAIGTEAHVSNSTPNSIQIGYGTNSTANSLSIGFYNSDSTHYNWLLLNGTTGLIPDARISSNIARVSDIPSAPDIDNKSITENSNDELQTVGVIDQNNASNAIKTWTGTKAQYDAIVTKDANTLYNITDDTDVTLPLLELLFPVGAVYFGTMSTCPLQTLGVGTWQALPQDKVIQIAGTRGSVGDTLNESLPNVTGQIPYMGVGGNGGDTSTGAFRNSVVSNAGYGTTGNWHLAQNVTFNASRSSSTYQDNAPVQQDAYLLNGWRRIA